MTDIENPPAFPREGYAQFGMTLRDWIAGQVVGALAQNADYTPTQIASDAYEVADAMILARKEPPK